MEAGLSQVELARKACVSNRHVSRVEKGLARPSAQYLQKLAAALNMTLDELLGGHRFHPAKPGRRPLGRPSLWLRRSFPPMRDDEPTATLRVTYRLATYTRLGTELLSMLEAQRGRPAGFWAAAKWVAERLNAPEQAFVLHLLVAGDDLARIGRPRRPWIGIVRQVQGGHVVLFAQVGVPVATGGTYTLDFVAAVSIDGRRVYINIELDGPGHRTRTERDRQRAEELGLPTIRVPVAEVDRRDFPQRLMKAIHTRVFPERYRSKAQETA